MHVQLGATNTIKKLPENAFSRPHLHKDAKRSALHSVFFQVRAYNVTSTSYSTTIYNPLLAVLVNSIQYSQYCLLYYSSVATLTRICSFGGLEQGLTNLLLSKDYYKNRLVSLPRAFSLPLQQGKGLQQWPGYSALKCRCLTPVYQLVHDFEGLIRHFSHRVS